MHILLIICCFFSGAYAEKMDSLIENEVKELLPKELVQEFSSSLNFKEKVVETSFWQIKLEKLDTDNFYFDQFLESDQEAVKAMVRIILSNFIGSARSFIDLKMIAINLQESASVLEEKWLNRAIEEAQIKFKTLSKQVTKSLIKFKELSSAMSLCTTTQCIQGLEESAQAMVEFASQLNEKESKPKCSTNIFNKLILDKSYRELINDQSNSKKNPNKAFGVVIQELLLI